MKPELPLARQQHPILEARNLSAVRANRVVFRGVHLTLVPGEIVALVGGNGAGKTTLLQCLAGALRPAGGEVIWLGNVYRNGPAARKLIGFGGHESSLYPALTPWENMLFACRMCGIHAPQKRAADLLSLIGLNDCAAQPTAQLSRGMRQRLAIARTVIHDPAIILLDEPFTSLDVDGRQWLTAFLSDLRKRQRALLLTTHEPAHGSGFVDRVVRLRAGSLEET